MVGHDLHLPLHFVPARLTGNVAWQSVAFEAEPLPGVVAHGFSGAASWYLSLRQFVRAALAGDPGGVAASFEEGVRTLALTLALERSLQAGGAPVEVP